MSSSAVMVPVSAAPTEHPTFLKRLGHLGLECITRVLPFVSKEAQKAEPIIDLLFPLEGAVFTSVVNAVCLAEMAGAKAAADQSTGELKLQAVWNTLGPQLLDLAHQHGLVGDAAEAQAKQYIQSIVQILNGPVKAAVDPSKPAS